MTHTAIEAIIKISNILKFDPKEIVMIQPEDGSGNSWIYQRLNNKHRFYINIVTLQRATID